MSRNLGLCIVVGALFIAIAGAEDPYRFFNWNVTYGNIYPLGVRQQVDIYNSIEINFFMFDSLNLRFNL